MTKEEFKKKLLEAVAKSDVSYLRGVLAVERKGKDTKRILWLETKIKEALICQSKKGYQEKKPENI